MSFIDLVRIEWPSVTVQELPNVAAQQFLTVTEPGGEPHMAATRDSGQIQLTLTGKQGSRYAIETSTALPNRTTANLIVAITDQSGVVTFPAPGENTDAQRFYRAVWRQPNSRRSEFLPSGREAGLVDETVCVQPSPSAHSCHLLWRAPQKEIDVRRI